MLVPRGKRQPRSQRSAESSPVGGAARGNATWTYPLPEQAQHLAEHDAAGEHQRRQHHCDHRGRNRAAHTVPADRRNDEPPGSRANAGADDDGDSTEDVRHTFRDGVVSSEPGPVRLSEWGASARKSAPPATRNISFYAWRAKSRLADVSRR